MSGVLYGQKVLVQMSFTLRPICVWYKKSARGRESVVDEELWLAAVLLRRLKHHGKAAVDSVIWTWSDRRVSIFDIVPQTDISWSSVHRILHNDEWHLR